MLHKIVDDLEQSGSEQGWCETTRTNLRDGKRYLKTEYRAHCREDESTCPDHCKRYALSDTQNSAFKTECDHLHGTECPQCELLKSTLTSIQTQISSLSVQLYGQEQKEDLLYDVKFAKDMVLEWKAHILRGQNQDQAKQDALRSLDNNTVLVIMDWAVKFTQMKYREKQSEWYGKQVKPLSPRSRRHTSVRMEPAAIITTTLLQLSVKLASTSESRFSGTFDICSIYVK